MARVSLPPRGSTVRLIVLEKLISPVPSVTDPALNAMLSLPLEPRTVRLPPLSLTPPIAGMGLPLPALTARL